MEDRRLVSDAISLLSSSRNLEIYMPLIALAYGVMSVIAFIAYGIDKRRARAGGWRISERTLHGLELAFGWPGALVAQSVFRHKRRKSTYRLVFWLIGALHIGGWGLYLVRFERFGR